MKKISKIKLCKYISPQIIQHLQYNAGDFTLEDEEGDYLCSLRDFLNKLNQELKIVEKIKQDEKKLEPSGAI